MEKEYISSYNRNYLKIKPQGELHGKLRYQYQIITGRELNGILKADFHIHNGESGLYYDITGKVNLQTLFLKKKLTRTFMNGFMNSLKTALWSLEQYLLDERNLLLHPEYIYVDMENMQGGNNPGDGLCFVYCPYFTEREERDAEPLLAFFLEKAEEEDSELMDAIFTLYAAYENAGDGFRGETFLHSYPDEICTGKADTGTEPDASETESRMLVKEENLCYEDVPAEQEERKLYGNGRQNRRVLTLTRFPVIIGRKPEYADLVINDPSIDNMHVKIVEEEGHIYMEDMNAAAGTFKNGRQLRPYERVELLREDEVKFGKLEFTYR